MLLLIVMLLVVFPALLLWFGSVFKTWDKLGRGSGRLLVEAEEPARVPDWVRRPMRKWSW